MCVEDGDLSREAEQRRRHCGGRACELQTVREEKQRPATNRIHQFPLGSPGAQLFSRRLHSWRHVQGPRGVHKPVFTCSWCCCEGSATFALDLTRHPWSPANSGIPSHYGKQGRDDLVCECGSGTPVGTGRGLSVRFLASLLVLSVSGTCIHVTVLSLLCDTSLTFSPDIRWT